jgi:hypothetical protein
MKRILLPVLLALSLGAVASVRGETGPARASYRISGEDAGLFGSYRNASYRLELVPKEVGESVARVEITPIRGLGSARLPLDPSRLASDVLECLDARAVSPQIRSLSLRLVARSGTVAEAQTAILGWIASNIAYEDDRNRSQEPAQVLASRSAHCVGMSNLAVDLLRAAGIPARPVSGVWVDERPESRSKPSSVPGRAGVYHRWVETWDPAVGWFFSDPIGRLDFVSALYLPFSERPSRAPGDLRVTPMVVEGSVPAGRFGIDRRGRPIWKLERVAAISSGGGGGTGAGSGGAR